MITPDTSPRFYEVAHEFGLVVDNETRVNREGRRSEVYRLCEKMKQHEEEMKRRETNEQL